MKILYTKRFARMLEDIPGDTRGLFLRQEEIFRLNWRDTRLHIKRLQGRPIFFSFRITRNYRVIFTLVEQDTALFAAIGNRKDIYR